MTFVFDGENMEEGTTPEMETPAAEGAEEATPATEEATEGGEAATE